ncbi:protein phosphatase CheZ [Xanthobacteraceae bacterium Astr-EGSB]|uniref:protein phosphatase CheZ n=1 Tax=Astrobacterium formosum TaxID=3069710 RepID=UPI0027B3C195|nr:protein phosphatase CheZ [Xanthobacteraceae bacterium Astr-EGSB]
MPAAKPKLFRIENVTPQAGGTEAKTRREPSAMLRHAEVMDELRELRRQLALPDREIQKVVESYKTQVIEAQKLKNELDLIQEAISKTKHEIATVHLTGFKGPEMVRVTNELDAIVGGTEQATQSILAAAEEIDQHANSLSAAVKNEHEKDLAHDIQDRVIHIFEACNFQDLTGQRISKVVATLKFIEQHIGRMMEIWGGIDAFKDADPEAFAEREGDKKLVNGPKLAGETGHASQDDIDALFG